MLDASRRDDFLNLFFEGLFLFHFGNAFQHLLVGHSFATLRPEALDVLSFELSQCWCSKPLVLFITLHAQRLLVGGLEHFFVSPYIGNNHPN